MPGKFRASIPEQLVESVVAGYQQAITQDGQDPEHLFAISDEYVSKPGMVEIDHWIVNSNYIQDEMAKSECVRIRAISEALLEQPYTPGEIRLARCDDTGFQIFFIPTGEDLVAINAHGGAA